MRLVFLFRPPATRSIPYEWRRRDASVSERGLWRRCGSRREGRSPWRRRAAAAAAEGEVISSRVLGARRESEAYIGAVDSSRMGWASRMRWVGPRRPFVGSSWPSIHPYSEYSSSLPSIRFNEVWSSFLPGFCHRLFAPIV